MNSISEQVTGDSSIDFGSRDGCGVNASQGDSEEGDSVLAAGGVREA